MDCNNTRKSFKPFFNINFLYENFCLYIKMSKDLSARYYQKPKKCF